MGYVRQLSSQSQGEWMASVGRECPQTLNQQRILLSCGCGAQWKVNRCAASHWRCGACACACRAACLLTVLSFRSQAGMDEGGGKGQVLGWRDGSGGGQFLGPLWRGGDNWWFGKLEDLATKRAITLSLILDTYTNLGKFVSYDEWAKLTEWDILVLSFCFVEIVLLVLGLG